MFWDAPLGQGSFGDLLFKWLVCHVGALTQMVGDELLHCGIHWGSSTEPEVQSYLSRERQSLCLPGYYNN